MRRRIPPSSASRPVRPSGTEHSNSRHGKMAAAELNRELPAPFRLTFRVRELPAAADGERRLSLGRHPLRGERQLAAGCTAAERTSRTCQPRRPDADQFGTCRETSTSPGGRWTTLELDIDPGRFELNAGRRLIGSGSVDLGTVRKVEFYAFNRDAAFDDIELLPARGEGRRTGGRAAGCFTPRSTARRMRRKQTAIRSIPTKRSASPTGPVSPAKPSSSAANRRRAASRPEAAESGGRLHRIQECRPEQRTLARAAGTCPELELSLDFRRTSMPEGDRHWGFDLTGENGDTLKLYTRPAGPLVPAARTGRKRNQAY